MNTTNSRTLQTIMAIVMTIGIGLTTRAATQPDSTVWHNPLEAGFPTVLNQAPGASGTYLRLPQSTLAAMNSSLREQWLTADGLSVSFFTDANEIRVRISAAAGDRSDMGELFRVDRDGAWHRCPQASDGLFVSDGLAADLLPDCEYRYFLPSSRVGSLELGVPHQSKIRFAPADNKRPIISVGICSDGRETLDWAPDLQRNLDLPVVSLAADGQSMDVDAVTELIGVSAPRLCIFDLAGAGNGNAQASALISAIGRLRRAGSKVPVMVVDRYNSLRHACDSLIKAGTEGLHYLGAADSRRQAVTIEDKAREILDMPEGRATTTVAVSQRRDIGTYDWHQRHLDICRYIDSLKPANLIIGNSIVQYWGGEPGSRRKNGPETWRKYMEPEGFANMGCGWDKIENVLWRVYHGELDGTEADNIVVMIGTNNLAFNTPAEIVDGIGQLIEAIGRRQPQARIILGGLLPRRGREPLVEEINRSLESLAADKGCQYINPGVELLGPDGKIQERLFRDGLHPNDDGYALIAPHIVAKLRHNSDKAIKKH